MKKKIFIGLLVVIIGIQFIGVDQNNPSVVEDVDFENVEQIPQEELALLKSSCYDCHANSTEYPWYFNIQPLAWWLKGHVRNGRDRMNFNEWGNLTSDQKRHDKEDCVMVLEKKWMPPSSYQFMHSEAKLTDEQRAQLIAWFTQ